MSHDLAIALTGAVSFPFLLIAVVVAFYSLKELAINRRDIEKTKYKICPCECGFVLKFKVQYWPFWIKDSVWFIGSEITCVHRDRDAAIKRVKELKAGIEHLQRKCEILK